MIKVTWTSTFNKQRVVMFHSFFKNHFNDKHFIYDQYQYTVPVPKCRDSPE